MAQNNYNDGWSDIKTVAKKEEGNWVPVNQEPSTAQKIKKVLVDAGKEALGVGENVLNQATNLGAMTVTGVPNMLGQIGAEVVDRVSQYGPGFYARMDAADWKDSAKRIGDRWHEVTNDSVYQPRTESGQRQVTATGNLMTGLSQGLDAIDDSMLDGYIKKNYPNAYAGTQVVLDFVPFVVAERAIKAGLPTTRIKPNKVQEFNSQVTPDMWDEHLAQTSIKTTPREEITARQREVQVAKDVAETNIGNRLRDKTNGFPITEENIRAAQESAFAADAELLAKQMSDGRSRQFDVVAETPVEVSPYQVQGYAHPLPEPQKLLEGKTLNPQIDTWNTDSVKLANEIANARSERDVSIRNEQLGRTTFNHDDLVKAAVTPSDSMKVLDPTVKPVVKGTVQQVLEMIKRGEVNAKDHTTLYPQGVRNLESPAFIIDKRVGNSRLNTIKKDLLKGNESEHLGYPSRENLPKDMLQTQAVTKGGEIIVDPTLIAQEAQRGNVAWSAEGLPQEISRKAEEVQQSVIDNAPTTDYVPPTNPILTEVLEQSKPKFTAEILNKSTGEVERFSIAADNIARARQSAIETAKEQYGTRAVNVYPEEAATIPTKDPITRAVEPPQTLEEVSPIPSDPVELFGGLPISKKGYSDIVEAVSEFVGDRTTPDLKVKFDNFIGLPQRLALSGKYPTYTKVYNMARDWVESVASIANDIHAPKSVPDNPYENYIGSKPLLKMYKGFDTNTKRLVDKLIKEYGRVEYLDEIDVLTSDNNILGKAVPQVVAEYIHEVNKLAKDIGRIDIELSKAMALYRHAGQDWYEGLTQWVKHGVTPETIRWSNDKYHTLIPDDAIKALEQYYKDTAKIDETLGKAINDKGFYFARTRLDGAYKVRVYEKNLDGSIGEEIFMRTAKDVASAKGMIQTLTKAPDDFYFGFPHHAKRLKEFHEVDKLTHGEQYVIGYYKDDIFQIGVPELNKKPLEDMYTYTGVLDSKINLIDGIINELQSSSKITPEFASVISNKLADTIVKQQMARGAGRAHMLREPNYIEGYDLTNPIQTMIDRASQMAGYHAKAKFVMEAARIMGDDISAQERYLINNYIRDITKIQSESAMAVGSSLRQVATLTQLAYRAMPVMANATQLATWGAPELGSQYRKLGIKSNAYKDISKAVLDLGKDANAQRLNKNRSMPLEEQQALDLFTRTGSAEAQNLRELAGLNRGMVSNILTKATETGMAGFSFVEVMNREAAFLASFRQFRKVMDFETAFSKAKDYSLEVNIDASRINYPGVVRATGEVGKTVYTFSRYSHSYISWLVNKAFRDKEVSTALSSLATVAAFGGINALPGFNEINTGVEKLLGRSLKLEARKYLNTLGGRNFEDAVMHGLPTTLFGIDVSSAMGVSMPFVSSLISEGDTSKALSGVVGGMTARAGRFWNDTYGLHDWQRGVEDFPLMPQGISNIMGAQRQYQKGISTNRGVPLYDENGEQMQYSAPEALRKGILSTEVPRVSRQREIDNSFRNLANHYNTMRERLVERSRRGQDVTSDIDKFNEMLDKYNIPVQPIRRIRSRKPNRRYINTLQEYSK